MVWIRVERRVSEPVGNDPKAMSRIGCSLSPPNYAVVAER